MESLPNTMLLTDIWTGNGANISRFFSVKSLQLKLFVYVVTIMFLMLNEPVFILFCASGV